jgi:MFS family permease
VATLSITTTTSYGVLYYAFPVLLNSIVDETGWTAAQATAAFSLGQVVSAIAGVAVGHWIDRHGPRGVMTAGSLAGALALVLVGTAGSYGAFVGAWVVTGAAMATLFYPPAFTALTHWAGERRVAALTTLTVVAGFASTIFAPLTAALDGRLGWRETYVVLAIVLAAVTMPLHWRGLRQPWSDAAPEIEPQVVREPSTALSRPFTLLAAAFSLAAFTVYASLVNLVPLLRERGLTAGQAAVILGIGGAGQVLGRLGYGRLLAAFGTILRTVVVIAGIAGTTVLLALLPGPAWALAVLSALAGMLRGLMTLVEATAVSDRWGTAGYGRLNGILSAPMLLAAAVAPFAGAAIAEATGSQSTSFLILAAVATVAAFVALGTRPDRADRKPVGGPNDPTQASS